MIIYDNLIKLIKWLELELSDYKINLLLTDDFNWYAFAFVIS